MTPSKQKGTAFEVSILPAFVAHYGEAERRAMQGANDKGDFWIPNEKLVTYEAKNHAKLDLNKAMLEAVAEARHAGTPFGVVVHKRYRVADPRRQWLSIRACDLLQLMGSAVGTQPDNVGIVTMELGTFLEMRAAAWAPSFAAEL